MWWIRNVKWIVNRPHLGSKFGLSIEMELLHDQVIRMLQHFHLCTTQMMPWDQMLCRPTSECQTFDASCMCSRNRVRRNVFYRSRRRAGEIETVFRLPPIARGELRENNNAAEFALFVLGDKVPA